ncbi:MAG: hypothetical protein ACLFVW_06035 [Phycisphaerae bacterium]
MILSDRVLRILAGSTSGVRYAGGDTLLWGGCPESRRVTLSCVGYPQVIHSGFEGWDTTE